MNKGEFLQKLREKLSVLEENELQDILSEYEQHIDMKAAGAMSEEEAIADFGDMDELTAQILSAYHVRADFAEKRNKTAGTEQGEDVVQRTYVKAKGAVAGGWKEFVAAIKHAWHFLGEKAESCADDIVRRFRGKKDAHEAALNGKVQDGDIYSEQHDSEQLDSAQQDLGQRAMQEGSADRAMNLEKKRKTVFSFFGGMLRWCGHAVESCLHFCWRAAAWCVKTCWVLAVWCVKNGWKAAIWCAKVCWNLFWGGTGITIGLFACMCLFGLGLLVVLLILGYPLLGITIGTLGMTLCTGSAAIWCFTLLLRRKKEEAVQDTEEAPVHKGEKLTEEGGVAHA